MLPSIPGTFFFFLMMDENELDQLSEAWDRNGHSLGMRIGPRPLPVFRRCASTLHFPPTNRKTQRGADASGLGQAEGLGQLPVKVLL